MRKIVLDKSLERFGWKKISLNGELYFKGHLFKHTIVEVESIFSKILEGNLSFEEEKVLLSSIFGHFALVYKKDQKVLCVVDKTQSIPLFFFEDSEQIVIGGEANSLVAQLKTQTVDRESLLSFKMSGYTVGRKTLLKELRSLNCGEYVKMTNGQVELLKYFLYSPWKAHANQKSRQDVEKELKDVTFKIFERVIKDVNGNPIVVPISGGYDSRLVASILKELDAPNVHCLSYGKPGNFDAETGKKVAKRLGFKWDFFPLDLKNQISYLRSDKLKEYIQYADTYYSVPFYQDNFVIHQLAEKGIFPKGDTVFINGNTGDFISGGHVPVKFKNITPGTDLESLLYETFINKHFALWRSLLTGENKTEIAKQLKGELELYKLDISHENISSLFEMLEYGNRQSKYVISGQRSYEYFGFSWRLPLWDDEFIQFWENCPVEYKYDQNLYKNMLLSENWGNVWKDIPLNVKYINPTWIIPIRSMLKTLHVPAGKEKWYDFEKRYLAYFMEPLGLYSLWPYWKIANDKRGARNIVSWRSEEYLKDKNLLF